MEVDPLLIQRRRLRSPLKDTPACSPRHSCSCRTQRQLLLQGRLRSTTSTQILSDLLVESVRDVKVRFMVSIQWVRPSATLFFIILLMLYAASTGISRSRHRASRLSTVRRTTRRHSPLIPRVNTRQPSLPDYQSTTRIRAHRDGKGSPTVLSGGIMKCHR